MAGPTTSILTDVFIQDKYDHLERFIQTIPDGDASLEGDNSWLFTPKNGKIVNRKSTEKDCSFVIGVQPFELLHDAGEISQISMKLGFLPTREISLAAMCNKVDDHMILGKLAYKVADMFDGFIDIGGVLSPPTAKSDDIEEIRNFVSMIKGKIIEIEHQTDSQTKWYSHIVDKTFLMNWLQSSNFHMIK